MHERHPRPLDKRDIYTPDDFLEDRLNGYERHAEPPRTPTKTHLSGALLMTLLLGCFVMVPLWWLIIYAVIDLLE